jgi:hypothetical protein
LSFLPFCPWVTVTAFRQLRLSSPRVGDGGAAVER